MKLWLDTTDSEVIKQAKKLGILYGVTTNPAIVAADGRPFTAILRDLLSLQEGPVAAQVIAQDLKGMLQQADLLRHFSDRIIVKIPVSETGLEAISQLSAKHVPVMATTIFQPHQALMAALAGARYVAPYVGQIEKNGGDPWITLKAIMQMYSNHSVETEILAASIPTLDHFQKCAELGVPHITFKTPIFQQLVQTTPQTQDWMNRFEALWKEANLSFLSD